MSKQSSMNKRDFLKKAGLDMVPQTISDQVHVGRTAS